MYCIQVGGTGQPTSAREYWVEKQSVRKWRKGPWKLREMVRKSELTSGCEMGREKVREKGREKGRQEAI